MMREGLRMNLTYLRFRFQRTFLVMSNESGHRLLLVVRDLVEKLVTESLLDQHRFQSFRSSVDLAANFC